MTATLKRNTLVWLALVLATTLSFTVSDTLPGRGMAAAILSVALLKSCLLVWEFMDLRTAHLVWKALVGTLLTSLTIALFMLRG